MVYQAYHPSTDDSPKAIYLYTTPLRSQSRFLGLKRPKDIFAHWALCIQGRCYELTRNILAAKHDPKFVIKFTDELEWIRIKEQHEGRLCKRVHAGNMTRAYSRGMIERVAELVWDKSLHHKYVYDEHNCQVFVRLLVELIGDQATEADFPQFFDVWLKRAGLARDISFMTMALGGTAIAAVAVATIPADPTLTTATAGVALGSSMAIRSGTALITGRILREKDIENGQREIRKELEFEGILLK